MALVKTKSEIETLKKGGRILAAVLKLLEQKIRPGVATMELEELAREEIQKAGARPAFLGYQPSRDIPAFPAALCVSIDEQVVHCVPRENRILKSGEVVSLDLGVEFEGLYTDAAITVPVGKPGRDTARLISATREALGAGIEKVKPGNTLGDVAAAISAVGKREGLGVIRDLVGHGVGHKIHEPPAVPNYGRPGTLERLKAGMVLAVEPMFTLGGWRIKFLPDGWTVVTADGSLAAHFEHSVAVTKAGCIILTE